MRPRLALIAALALTLAVPAHAAATRLTLLASGPQGATANGAAFSVGSYKEMLVCVDVTAASGTSVALTVFLQSSADGGTTFFDLPADKTLLDANTSASDQTAGTGKRNILTCAATCASPQKACSQYTTFGDTVRVRWVMSGTSPSATFSVRATVKP